MNNASAKTAANGKGRSMVFDWNGLSEAGAFLELSRRVGVTLSVTEDGKLTASGSREIVGRYLLDIATRYRGAIIARLLGLPPPDVLAEVERENVAAISKALDLCIDEFFCIYDPISGEDMGRILDAKKRMPVAYLVQNLCAFRTWLFECEKSEWDV